MGVIVDPPLQQRAQAANIENVYGSAVDIDAVSSTITIRLLVCQENLPEYVIGQLGPNELLQTNVVLTVPFDWVAGSFRVWPPQLFQADCIPQNESCEGSRFLGRIVVADMQIHMDGENSCGDGTDTEASFEMFTKLAKGDFPLTLSRLKPFPAQAALAFLYHTHELEGGLSPPASAYRGILGHALTDFARKKAEHARSSKDPHSFRPDMPGRALMEMLYRYLAPEEREISISNGNMMVKVRNLNALGPVFAKIPKEFNFREEGLGLIEIHGPFVFKWSMYDTLDASGPLAGSVSISVGSYTEYSRMGTDVIKSSKCHPDAIRASIIPSPAEKKARTSSTAGRCTEKAKQASKAPAQAIERMQRQVRRMRVSGSAGVSGSTSDSAADEIDARRSTNQPPHISSSDSQSGGDGPAVPGSESETHVDGSP
jgi:hypothetical protein